MVFVAGVSPRNFGKFTKILQNPDTLRALFRIQKQPSRNVLIKRCFENKLQIYRRTPMLKCDFNKVAKQLY